MSDSNATIGSLRWARERYAPMRFHKQRKPPTFPAWQPEWDQLAQYNAERARGLIHAPEWQAHMETIRTEFNQAHFTPEELATPPGSTRLTDA